MLLIARLPNAFIQRFHCYRGTTSPSFLGELRSGSPVNIADIADDLSISTAPVRDALVRLSERGMITRIEGRGFFVTIIPDHEAAELLKILHAIVSLSIERHGSFYNEPLNSAACKNKQCSHDKLNILLEQICSPHIVSIAIGVADRLWEIRKRIGEQPGNMRQEERLIEIVRKSLKKFNKKRTLRILNSSHIYCQNFLMGRIVPK